MCFISSHEALKHLLLSLNALRVLRFVLSRLTQAFVSMNLKKHAPNSIARTEKKWCITFDE